MMLSVILAFYADNISRYSYSDQTSDQWPQVELASDLESDLLRQGMAR